MSGVPSWAVRGAKVVCVKVPQTRRPGTETLPEPQLGKVYTLDGWAKAARGGAWVGLVEMNPRSAFEISMFRPAVEPKTEAEDLTHFRPFLHQNAPEGIDA